MVQLVYWSILGYTRVYDDVLLRCRSWFSSLWHDLFDPPESDTPTQPVDPVKLVSYLDSIESNLRTFFKVKCMRALSDFIRSGENRLLSEVMDSPSLSIKSVFELLEGSSFQYQPVFDLLVYEAVSAYHWCNKSSVS